RSRTALQRSATLFLQAEDGIRDLIVTGVQTCALPIYLSHPDGGGFRRQGAIGVFAEVLMARRIQQVEHRILVFKGHHRRGDRDEIGRASCRERGESAAVEVAVKKKNEVQTEWSIA